MGNKALAVNGECLACWYAGQDEKYLDLGMTLAKPTAVSPDTPCPRCGRSIDNDKARRTAELLETREEIRRVTTRARRRKGLEEN